jgi:hypothetical protein
MSTRFLTPFLVVIAALAVVPVAQAQENEPRACGDLGQPGVRTGPVVIELEEAGFRSARRACHRTEVSLVGFGSAAIDTPDFYGSLLATVALGGSFELSERFELFGTLEAFQLRYAQNASLKTTNLGLGQLTLGGSYQLWQQERWVVSVSARVMLPTKLPNHNAWTAGLAAGLSGELLLARAVQLHGYLGADLASGIFGTPALPRGGLLALVGTELRPWSFLAVAFDLQLHLGERGAFDFFAPAVELRAGKGAFGGFLGGSLRLAGPDRHDFAGQAGVSWRF